MPTGVALRDAREQLFDAAERVLLRDGPSALTSRAVTTEAGVAKGVLHRHFADFDAFLAELVLDRAARVDGPGRRPARRRGDRHRRRQPHRRAHAPSSRRLRSAILGLVISRDDLRARLRQAGSDRRPYPDGGGGHDRLLPRRRARTGRIAAGADVDTLAPTIIGAAHLLFADREVPPPDSREVDKVVTMVIAGLV